MSVYLVIYSPDGEIYRTEGQEDDHYDLSHLINSTNRQITIGRTDPASQFDVSTDIKLPAEDMMISRKHFVIEVIEGAYYYVKRSISDSVTELYEPSSGQTISITQQGQRLRHGDQILLQSIQGQRGSPNQYWKFQFFDLNATTRDEPVRTQGETVQATVYEYKSGYGLYVSLGSGNPIRIEFTGKELELLEYLALHSVQTGDNNNNHRTVSYEELIKKIWPGENHGDRKRDLSNIVSRINKKIRDKCSPEKIPELISNSSGVGYRLNSCTVTK